MVGNLERQRTAGSRLLIGTIWLLAVVVAASALITGAAWMPLSGAAIVFAGLSTAVWSSDKSGRSAPTTIGVTLMVMVSLLVAAAGKGPWQIDMHMAYFAALSLLIVYCDWRVIAAAAATVAVHHLVLNFVLPAAVFPGGGDLPRVLVHAVILVAEAAVLMLACNNILRMIQAVNESATEANAAARAAESATQDLEEARRSEAAAAADRAALQEKVHREQQQVVSELAGGLSGLANGDLTRRLETPFATEYDQLRRDYNAAVDKLSAIISGIHHTASVVRSGAGELSSASEDLSRRTEHQAASLEETAAALEEITATVTRSASGSRDAAAIVSETRADAGASGQIVEQAVAAMGRIEQSSAAISQIIGVIDEIAFQTNLLALNAGVEAARAGEAGRGFAVVASEVRALAQRSADAAKEIKSLINASTEEVSRGVRHVGEAGEALTRIAGRIEQINGLVAEIAASAQEQSAGIKDVNSAVSEMDRVVQQNAAMVEQSTAAITSLSQEAAQLMALVSQFRVSGSPLPVARAA